MGTRPVRMYETDIAKVDQLKAAADQRGVRMKRADWLRRAVALLVLEEMLRPAGVRDDD